MHASLLENRPQNCYRFSELPNLQKSAFPPLPNTVDFLAIQKKGSFKNSRPIANLKGQYLKTVMVAGLLPTWSPSEPVTVKQ